MYEGSGTIKRPVSRSCLMNEPWPFLIALLFTLINRPIFGYISQDPKWRNLTLRRVLDDPSRIAQFLLFRGEFTSMAMYAVFAVTITLVSSAFGRARWIFAISALCGCSALLVLVALRVAKVRQKTMAWRDRIEELDLEACTACGYALKGLPRKHKCPECGKSYDKYRVKLEWSRRLKRLERDAMW